MSSLSELSRLAAALVALTACPASPRAPAADLDAPVFQTGVASFYSDALAGRPTASGEPYDPAAATCAHRKLPFGTVLSVERIRGGQTARCTVNDRGPFHDGRIVDLSRRVAEALEIEGVAKVRLRIVQPPGGE